MVDENSIDAGLTAKEEMERVTKEIVGRLHREMDERLARLHDTDTKFGFFLVGCRDTVLRRRRRQ